MTQIESAALAWISFAIAGNAIFAIALSSTDNAIPTARFRIAQYLSGSGSPSSAVLEGLGGGAFTAWGEGQLKPWKPSRHHLMQKPVGLLHLRPIDQGVHASIP